jgi:hypothetical protein
MFRFFAADSSGCGFVSFVLRHQQAGAGNHQQRFFHIASAYLIPDAKLPSHPCVGRRVLRRFLKSWHDSWHKCRDFDAIP